MDEIEHELYFLLKVTFNLHVSSNINTVVIKIQWKPDISTFPITRTKSRFLRFVSLHHPRYLELPISQTNISFPLEVRRNRDSTEAT